MKETTYQIVKELLQVKSNYLYFIENIDDIKADILYFCRAILKHQNLSTDIVQLHLEHEININSYFQNKHKNDLYANIEAIESLIKINESLIYGYSQQLSIPNNTYKYYHDMSEIICDLNKKLLPQYVIRKLNKNHTDKQNLNNNVFRDVYNDPSSDYFWESLKLNQKFTERERKILEIGIEKEFIEVSDFFGKYKFHNSINDEIISELSQYNHIFIQRLRNICSISEDYDVDNISKISFRKILDLQFLDKTMIYYDISNNINNQDIQYILDIFPEFVLGFSIMESRPFYKRKHRQGYQSNNKNYKEHEFFGKYKIRKPYLKLHEKAVFLEKDEKLIFKLLDKLNLDKNLYNINDKSFIL